MTLTCTVKKDLKALETKSSGIIRAHLAPKVSQLQNGSHLADGVRKWVAIRDATRDH